jgi:hypothetical protein
MLACKKEKKLDSFARICTTLFFFAASFSSVYAQVTIDSAFVSFRIGIGQSLTEKRFTELVNYFDKYKGVTSEITFFTSATHPPIPLDTLKKRVSIFKDRMVLARQRGYRTGINVLNTVGHLNENLDNSLHGDYTHMTDIDGRTYDGAYCPNDEKFTEEYIRPVYKATALAKPDYIWIDDDVRLRGYGFISYACFCDHCIDIFATEFGQKYTRAALKKALDEGPVEKKLQVRRNWLQHNRNTMSRLFTMIEKEVHAVDRKIALGFMSSDLYYAGYDFENWSKILEGPYKVPVMWRPGGGAYDDLMPGAFIGKAHSLGRQASALPQDVRSIQSEIENFPYPRFKKSASMVAFEAAAYIAAGCTGAAYNVLTFYDEPLDEYEPLAAALQHVRPFLNLMTKHLGRTPLTGAFSYWNKNSEIAGNPVDGSWFNSKTPVSSMELYENGIPATYSQEHASVTMMTKDMIYALSKEEIKKLLSGAIYIDGDALQQLNDLGYADLTGFEVARVENKDRIERLTAHPLNGSFAGRLRDNRQSFWMVPAYTFKKRNEKAQILSELCDYTNKTVGACTMGIFENSIGGRICVAGYYPWVSMGNLAKNTQIKSVFRWLSKDQLPGYISSFHKINMWIREQKDNTIALAISNSSFDAATDVHLLLRTKNNTIKLYDMDCKQTVITATGTDGPYKRFIIPQVNPWQIMLAVNE